MAYPIDEPPGRHPACYQIKIKGKIREDWSDWFSGMDISTVKNRDNSLVTTLVGMVSDQATLRGILCHLWDLNLTILSIAQTHRKTKDKK